MAPAGQRSYAPRVASVAHAWHPRAKGHMYHAWHLSPMRGTRGPKVICTTRGICRPCVAPAGQRSYVPRVASVAHRCICHVWTTCQVYGQKHKIGTTLGELNWLDAILQKHSTASLRMDIGTYVYGASGGMTLVRGKSRGTFCNPLCALAILVPHVATRRSLCPPPHLALVPRVAERRTPCPWEKVPRVAMALVPRVAARRTPCPPPGACTTRGCLHPNQVHGRSRAELRF